MLHVSFAELMGRAQQQMFANQSRFGMQESGHVLQLVSKAERPARLVVAAARPESARQCLIQQPAVGQHIHGRIGRLDMDRAERPVPEIPDSFQRVPRVVRSPKALDQLPHVVDIAADSQREDDLAFPAVGEFERHLHRRAGIEPAPTLPDSRVRDMAAGLAALPLRPRNSVRSPVTLRAESWTSTKAMRSGNSMAVGIAGQQGTALWDRSR